MPTVSLHTSLKRLPDLQISAKQGTALAALGCHTLGDLLLHLPRRYEDRQRFEAFPNQPMERAVCLCGIVTDTKTRFAGRRRFSEVTVENVEPGPFDGPLVCRWFQMPWVQKLLAVGQQIVIYGKPKLSGQRLVIDHPEMELVDEAPEEASVHLGRVAPIYPLTSGISQRPAREILYRAWESVSVETVPNVLPDLPEKMVRWQAIRTVHFPDALEEVAEARRYLALEEFVQVQLTILARRADYRKRQGARHAGSGELLKRFYESLSFSLTSAQTRAVEEIRGDLNLAFPMNRLLQGDVGSGKTLVAISAMLLAVEAGFQAALMAPTQILAEQHYQVIQRWLKPLGIRVSLRTADRVEDGFLPLMAGGEDPQILIGTHALLYDKVEVGDQLGLVIVDEQHKFGVLQRGKLMQRATLPDILVMTATPIPRTLTMTLYGDLDVSILNELPKGRGKIITAVRTADKTPEAATFLKEQIVEGRQAYIVYPLIEESEKLKLANATQAFTEWKERLGEDVSVGLLHGRMSGEEKEAVMAKFRANEVHVLVSTTVIEVGVDVPNANVMYIYHAERFGLAQLHQLRGRIGRGEHKSYCVLMHAPENKDAMEKLKILADTRDGFKIAEA
ncbi:MAG: ATP-dependent DNA helicase RecG, partial [Verrucomicrobiales bacterium]